MTPARRQAVVKDLEAITEKIVEEFQPEKIILFGSLAWGEPGPESDADLLIVKRTPKSTRDVATEIRRALWGSSVPMDILVYTPEQLEQRIAVDRNLFLEDIVKNGVTLYERHDEVRE